MRALENIRAALRPGGVLLDIRPAPRHSRVEVRIGDCTVPLGRLDESEDMPCFRAADETVRRAVDAGMFRLEREVVFQFMYHADDVDAWLAYMAAKWRHAAVGPALVTRAQELLAQQGGEVRIHRQLYAARLRRA